MVEKLNTNQAMVNLTLSVYFAAYAIGLLFWGPLSEKFGRKPILLMGLGIYVIGSVLCALSNFVEMLIGARLLQAFGGSAVTVVATAIVKDLYDGREREKIIATIMSLVIIAPMVAPVLGALLLKIANWHMMFAALAVFGSVAMLFTFFYRETLHTRYAGSVFQSWGRLAVVVKNPPFLSLLAVFTIVPMALMSFLAAGSYVYINGFGLSEQTFSYAFAANAVCASFGPTIYMRLSKRVSVKKIITASFLTLTACGISTIFIGGLSPWVFGALAAIATLTVIITRVPGTNLMLEQQTTDTGSAVAVIQFCSMIAGAIGMAVVSLNAETLIKNLGVIQLSIGLIALTLWLVFKNKAYVSAYMSKV